MSGASIVDYTNIHAIDIVYYGPHLCDLGIGCCKAMIVKSGNGHQPVIRLDAPNGPTYPNTPWAPHTCPASSTGNYGLRSPLRYANVSGGELPDWSKIPPPAVSGFTNSETHRHCIFCGVASYPASNQSGVCLSENNPTPQDTFGNRYHAYLR